MRIGNNPKRGLPYKGNAVGKRRDKQLGKHAPETVKSFLRNNLCQISRKSKIGRSGDLGGQKMSHLLLMTHP